MRSLYFYPGHSYTPLHHLSSLSTALNPLELSNGASSRRHTHYKTRASKEVADVDPAGVLCLYGVERAENVGTDSDDEDGLGWGLVLVFVVDDEQDGRIRDLKRHLYPGAILHLPLDIYTKIPDKSRKYPNVSYAELRFIHPSHPSQSSTRSNKPYPTLRQHRRKSNFDSHTSLDHQPAQNAWGRVLGPDDRRRERFRGIVESLIVGEFW